MPKWLGSVIGAAEIAAGAALLFTGVGAAATGFLVAHGIAVTGAVIGAGLLVSGIGTEIAGLGTLLAKGPLKGTSTTIIDPISPWEIPYGRNCIGGTLIHDYEWGDSNKYRDMVIVIADCQIQDVYGLMFDKQRIQIDTTSTLAGVPPSNFPAINGGTSFTPVQQTVDIQGISRVNNVVTVQLGSDIPLLVVGDEIIIQNVVGDKTLNGTYHVLEILSQIYDPPGPGSIIFTYLCGGPEVSYIGQGQAMTNWPDYGRNVYIEVLQGQQTLGETFVGMISGTPTQGDPTNPAHPGAGTNPWTNFCSCVGKAVVMLRINYSATYFSNGLPQISFLSHGKNNIYDPRTQTTGYSENAALCTADMMMDLTWGFQCYLDTNPNAAPGKTINSAQLILAANICDQQEPTATPITSPPASEPRYTINGRFTLDMRRGDILRDMLSAMGGRITFNDGEYFLWPAAWYPTLVVAAPGYTGQSVITQNASQVAGAPQLNFPMLISGTYPQLKSAANGGQVQNASGFDITFSLDNQGLQLTNWEVEHWDPTTGQIIAWVLISLSNTNDTQFFMNYGNLAITTFQGGAKGTVWAPAGYNAVLHLGNGSALSGADSTANSNNATLGGSVGATTGVIDGAASFDGSTAYLSVPNQMEPSPPINEGSVELWAQNGSFSGSTTYFLMGVSGGVGAPWPPAIYAEGIGIHILGWLFGNSNRTVAAVPFTVPFWLFCISWSEPQNFVNLYANGVLVDSIPYDSAVPQFPNPYPVGGAASWAGYWLGKVDEFRLNLGALTGDWEATRYNNETSPSTFYSLSNMSNMPINTISQWGPIKWRATSNIRDLYNGVKGTYINPANNWQSSDFPPYCQDNLHGYDLSPLVTTDLGDINLIYDGGDRRWLDIQLRFTISCATAQRLAKIELLRRRHSAGNPVGTGEIDLNMAGYLQTALDIVQMTFPPFAWTDKILEVSSNQLLIEAGDNGAVKLGTKLFVQESDPSVYDWSTTEELSPAGYQQDAVPGSDAEVQPPTNVVAMPGPSASINEAGGVGQSTIIVTWTAPADGYVTEGGRIDGQYQVASSPPGPWIALPSVAPSVTSVTITGLQNGYTYTVQIRSVNAAGVPSAWITAQSNTSPPVDQITITGGLTQIYLVNGVG